MEIMKTKNDKPVYLWSGGSVDTKHLVKVEAFSREIPYVTDLVADHIANGYRYTVDFYRGSGGEQGAKATSRSRNRAERLAKELVNSLQQRYPSLDFDKRFVAHGRTARALQFMPVNEWHPERIFPHKAINLESDASWVRPEVSRAGIVGPFSGSGVRAVALAPARPHSSNSAEFLATCLAMLALFDSKRRLKIKTDEMHNEKSARLLSQGIFPVWMHEYENHVNKIIIVSAMLSARLRKIDIVFNPGSKLSAAHLAAKPNRQKFLSPEKWAIEQGLPLSLSLPSEYQRDR